MENSKTTFNFGLEIKAKIYDLMVIAEQYRMKINDIQTDINKLTQELHEAKDTKLSKVV